MTEIIESTDTTESGKITAEHLVKFTVVKKENLNIFFIRGGSHSAFVHGLRIDGKRRRSLLAVGNTLTKGLWWKGEETGGVPKYLWYAKTGKGIHVFIGRLSFLIESKRFVGS